jgi:hypothetical protein
VTVIAPSLSSPPWAAVRAAAMTTRFRNDDYPELDVGFNIYQLANVTVEQ